jgi:hypothetical protein
MELKDFKGLPRQVFSSMKVTDAGITELREAQPQCGIYY